MGYHSNLTPESYEIYDRAVKAEYGLKRIERMVDLLCATAPKKRSKKAWCYGCIWDGFLKGLLNTYVGYGRVSTKNTWLRNSETWDAVAGVLLKKLYDADPGLGCGLAVSIEERK